MGDPRRAFRQRPPGARRETSAPHHHAVRHSHRPTRLPGHHRRQPRYRSQAAAAGPATPANTRARASPRHHRPSRRHEPSHDNRQHILLVPMMSRHGHRRLLRVAPPCLLAVPTPPAAGITHPEATASRRSAAGPAPAQPGSHATPQARARRHHGAEHRARIIAVRVRRRRPRRPTGTGAIRRLSARSP
jgi:hypothetical protein